MKNIKRKIAFLLIVLLSFTQEVNVFSINDNDLNGDYPLGSIEINIDDDIQSILDSVDVDNSYEKRSTKAADTTEYINLKMNDGKKAVANCDLTKSATTTNNNVATFSKGVIYAHKEGFALVKVPMKDGSTKTFKTSVYYTYPKPKTATVEDNGVYIYKCGDMNKNNSDRIEGIAKNTKVNILRRVRPYGQSGGSSMQYITTSNGKKGYITSSVNTDRGTASYYKEVKVDSSFVWSTYSGMATTTYNTDNKWTASDTSVVKISSVKLDGFNNQCQVNAKKEGFSVVTATSADKSVITSIYVSSYTPLPSTNAQTSNDTTVYSVSSDTNDSNNGEELKKDTDVKIIGQSGDYYKIGIREYVKKQSLDIPITDIKLNYNNALMYENASLELKSTIKPNITTTKPIYTSSDEDIASVDENGVVTSKKRGSVTITSYSKDDSTIKDTCVISVIAPIKKIDMPLANAMRIGSNKTLSPKYIPSEDADLHTLKWSSDNESIATVDTKGGISAKNKMGIVYINHEVTPPPQTISTTTKKATNKTLVSVYNDNNKGKLLQTTKKIKCYISAVKPSGIYKYLESETKDIQSSKILYVIGTSNNFYYVRYQNSSTPLGFIEKTNVKDVNIRHTEKMPISNYTPLKDPTDTKSVKLLRPSPTVSVKSAIAGKSASIEKKKKVNTGRVNIKKKGVSKLDITRTWYTNKKKTKVKSRSYYKIHMTMAYEQVDKTGYITQNTPVYSCASNTCYYSALQQDTPVTVDGYLGNYLRIRYKNTNGKEIKNKYVYKNNVSYVNIKPIIMSKDNNNTITRNVGYNNMPSDEQKITQIINNYRDKVSVTKQSDNQISIKNKKKACFVNATVKSGINKDYITYVPISVYTPLTRKINAYIRTSTPLLSGATTSKYKITYMKLKKYKSVKIVGTLGNYFYIDTKNENVGYNGRGFVKKSDVVYIECSPKFRTARKNTTRQIDVVVHNNGVSGLKWKTDKNRVFKKGKYTKKGKKKLPYTTKRTYNLKSKTEYAGYKTVSKRTANDKLFISSYSPTERIEGFITIKQSNKYDYVKLWKAATDDFGYYKQLPRYTKVTILGTCKDYYYVSAGGRKGYAKKVNVAYIGFGSFSRSMYRYHNKTVSATLTHPPTNTSYQNIKWSVTKNGSAITNKKTFNNNGYKKLSFFADKPKTVTFTAKYYYNGSKYISRKVSVKIKPIKIIASNISVKVGTSKKLNAKVQTLPKAKVTYSIPKQSIIKVSKGKVTAKNLGKVKVTAKYRALKKTFYVTVKPLLIYRTSNTYKEGFLDPDNELDWGKPEDIIKLNWSSKQLLNERKLKKIDFEKSEKGLVNNFKGLKTFNAMSPTLKPVAEKMMNHFINGHGESFSDPVLDKAIYNHISTKEYIKHVREAFSVTVKKDNKFKKQDLSNLEYKDCRYRKQRRAKYPFINYMATKEYNNPVYNTWPNKFTGMTLMVDSIWGSEISVSSFKKKSNGKYSITLQYRLYDHFGLDYDDINKFAYKPIIGFKFRAWYVLQHCKNFNQNKYIPFITFMRFEDTFEL